MGLSSSHNSVKKELIHSKKELIHGRHSLEKSFCFQVRNRWVLLHTTFFLLCRHSPNKSFFMCTDILLNKVWYIFPVDFRSSLRFQKKKKIFFFSQKSKNMIEPSSHTVLQLRSLPLNLLSAAVSCDQRKLQAVPCLKFLWELKLTNNELLQASVYFRL